MPYEIRFTDSLEKGVIVVEDREINSDSTSLSFPGKGVTNYGKVIAENSLHLLENFAFETPPSNPVEGQLWYDNSEGVDQLKIYDGTSWVSASGIFKAASAPEVSSALAGDLWVDTDNQQLYLNSGAGWVLVGPEFSQGLSTGPRTAQLVGTDNNSYTVLILDVAQEPVAILSGASFVPKTTIAGFSSIQPGINLTTKILTSGSLKFRGTAENAEALRIGNVNVAASNFLRSDQNTTANGVLSVRNDRGIIVGANGQLTMRSEGEAAVISNNFDGARLDLRVKQGTEYFTGIRIKSNPGSTPSIGVNTLNPQATFDVTGDVRISDVVKVEADNQTSQLNEGALQVSGGTSIARNLYVGGDTDLSGNLSIDGSISGTGASISGFNTVTANEFIGTVKGSLTGTVEGSSTSATRLTNVTSFQLAGDVSSPEVLFDGTGSLSKTFTTSISSSFISDKDSIPGAIQRSDQLLVHRAGTGIRQSTAGEVANLVPTNPVGMVAPYAGDVAPPGWLLCDGREIPKATAADLYDVIGDRFSAGVTPALGNFRLPDLRGRHPMGLDNMGGVPANRVDDVSADTLGFSGGSESADITKSNLPQHEHDLRSSGDSGTTSKQYYAIRDAAAAGDDSPEVTSLSIETGTSAVTGIPTSGSIIDGGQNGNDDYRTVNGEELGSPLPIMNPYLAMNYIIWAGV